MKRYTALFIAALAGVGLVMQGAAAQGADTATGPATATAPASGPATTQAAEGNPFDNDFTKGMGKWTIAGCEAKQVNGEGVKFTDMGTVGGLLIEGTKAVDLSGTPNVYVQIENGGDEAAQLHFKVKTGKKSDTKDFKAAPGKSTFNYNLGDLVETDIKKIDYMRVFGQGAVKLTIKKITLK